jgi:hypothetical protein
VEADDAGLIERFRDKWIGDNEEMLADLHAVILASLSAAKVEVEKEVERLLKAIADRKAVYEAKRDQADPLKSPDFFNRHDLFNHAVEAFEHLESEVAALSNEGNG